MPDFEWLLKNGAVAVVAVIAYIFLQNYIGEAAKTAWKLTAENSSKLAPRILGVLLLFLLFIVPTALGGWFVVRALASVLYGPDRQLMTSDLARVLVGLSVAFGLGIYLWVLGSSVVRGYLKRRAEVEALKSMRSLAGIAPKQRDSGPTTS